MLFTNLAPPIEKLSIIKIKYEISVEEIDKIINTLSLYREKGTFNKYTINKVIIGNIAPDICKKFKPINGSL
jgi:hypothetical protein